ncbi:MAG: endonuclease domain-containing protein [Pseudomonadota bacterium]
MPRVAAAVVAQAAPPPHPDPLPAGGEGENEWCTSPQASPPQAFPRRNRNAQRLRDDPTEVEKLLWWKLRARQFGGWKFRRQVPIVGFVADFACLEAGLVIELDGGQHSETGARDERRTAILGQAGFRVLRFWNNQLIDELESVLATIEQALGAPSPRPSPRGGEGEIGVVS